MDVSQKKTNWFVRIYITLFCSLLTGMVLYRFFILEPKGEINSGLISLLSLLLVLILSESFDNFSIGKLISITRESNKKEKEIDKLEKQNSNLLNQLISISNTQSQNQNHTNVYGDYHASASVQKATEADVQDKQSSDSATQSQSNETQRLYISWRKAESIAIQKYLNDRSIHPSNAILDAKLVTQFHGIDPISNMHPVFDAYIKDGDQETFVELRANISSHMIFRDRLYYMLSKIHLYRLAKRVDAHLDLVFMKIPNEESRITSSIDRLIEYFQPAIASGLLKIHEVEFSEEEASKCRE